MLTMFVLPKRKDEDPEKIQRQKNLARLRFKAIARSVIANLYWMEDSTEPYEGDNVQRRVEQVMKSKMRKKQLLSINDKALLNKPAKDRTEHEKRYIYRVIGGLKCFKRYPNHVKKKLAAVTYFKYYGPNRVVVRENQDAEALYFVVTGEVTVSKVIYDALLQQHISIDVFVMKPGDMFGEVSLLHNIPRTATCTTTSHCEFLALMKEDFKNVLQGSLQKQWAKVQLAMESFPYFDQLDPVSRRDGCIVAKMKSYEPNETVLGDGVEVPNFVYFILSGRCQMIESLNIETIQLVGRKTYKLHDDYVSPKESEQNLNEKYFNKKKEKSVETVDTTFDQNQEPETETRADGETKVRLNSDVSKPSLKLGERKSQRYGSVKLLTSESKKAFDIEEFIEEPQKEKSSATSESLATFNSMLSFMKSPSKHKQSASSKDEPMRGMSSMRVASEMLHPPKPPPYKTHFMQVCLMSWGSTFNLGENMRDRRIVAQTRVECMLLPKVWLMQYNPANVWSRILYYLEKKIPTKKELFKEFVKQRQWQEYKDKVVKDVVGKSHVVNFTTKHDVPYSIRMDETLDI